MLIYALNFLLGIVVFSLKNTTQITSFEWGLFLVLILSFFALFKRHKPLSFNIAVFLLGFAWMSLFSNQIINAQVPNIHLNKPLLVQGKISQLPEQTHKKTKFIFEAQTPFKGRLKLSWYGTNYPPLKTGDTWQLLVKLKRNNGYQNLGGFDYEKWLFYKQINATGYVRSSDSNHRLEENQTLSIDQLRQETRRSLRVFLKDLNFGGVINALIIGDRSFITDSHWELFQSTNTTHLSVISGLHIGLISGLVFLLTAFIWKRCAPCTLRIPAQVMGSYFGILSALLYALIAGFSIPTGRAFIMASVVFISIILRRHHNVWQLYGIALLLTLMVNPVSIFSVGFWLSFYVVAVIIYGAGQHRDKSWIYRLIYIQLLITLSTIPLIAWFFNTGSILSPIANLVAIPVFSFITTPLSLIGALFALSNLTYLAEISFEISSQSLIALSYLLDYLKNFSFNLWHYTQSSSVDLILFISAIFIAILPKELKLRRLSLLILVLTLFSPTPKLSNNSALITVLDIGQGLSTLVQTRNHILLFDTGAAYPSGFNMGNSVINPYLKTKQIKYLDKIIISHGDNDHIGGLKSVLGEFNALEILTSVPDKITQTALRCNSGQTWQWDGVLFEILNPSENANFKGNNASCVLKVSTRKYSILLTGDIEKKAEKYLVKTHKNKLDSTIMLSPHHGSKTSSTTAFLNAVSPDIIIISSGFKNRFNHPAKTITDRYNDHNIQSINTNCAGQIEIGLADEITISKYRKKHQRFYMRQCETL